LKTSKKHERVSLSEHQNVNKEHKIVGTKEEKAEASPIREKAPGNFYPIISTVVMIILLALVIYLLVRPSTPATPGTTGYTGDKVKVEFYVMSQCPYGTQVEDAIAPVLEQMNGAVDFQLNYIVREASPGVFQSLHGEKEVAGNIVQLCAKSYYPDQYFKMIICQNKDAANVDTNWQACAQTLGMDTAKLQKCAGSDEGKGLLRTSMQASLARGASGSPTMYINDVAYQGARDAASFQREICKNSKHPSCSAIPKCGADTDCTGETGKEGYCINPGKANAACEYKDPVALNYVILNDKKCASCDTTRLVQVTQQLFLGGKPRLVDVSSDEGKALVKQYNITVVPDFIYDSNIVETKSWVQMADLKTAFEELPDGKYKLLDEVTGANYFVSDTARKAYYDAIGVKLGDNKPQIDFFVMSYCPFGNQAEEGIEPAYQLLKGKADFKPHYVIYANYQGGGADYCIDSGKLCSMHGIQEVHQDVREICVNKYMGIDKWFAFALAMNKQCTAQNADSCWEAVATGLSLNTTQIKDCEAKESVALLTAEQALGNTLKVSGSPTVFVDGNSYSGGRTPDEFKTGLCAAFDTQPAECSTKLAGPAATDAGAAAAPAAGGCGV
jgi:hypothetical protein